MDELNEWQKARHFIDARLDEIEKVLIEYLETKNLLNNILQSAIKYSIMGNDLNYNLLFWNEGARRNYGYTSEEILGKNSNLLHVPEDIASGKVRKFLEDTLKYEMAEQDFQRVRKDGSFFMANVVASVRYGAEGKPIGFLIMSNDITEQRKSEKEKLEQSLILEDINKELEAFSYSVSHDLQAPLRAINGFARAVIEDYGEAIAPEGQRFLSLIEENAKIMGRLIQDLLSFSRLGRQQISRVEVKMEDLVRKTYESIISDLPKRNVHIRIQTLPNAYCDPSMMRQVFTNLLSNALKFTRNRDIAEIEVGFEQDEEEIIYYVKDNGAGFNMRYINKLFGVFQRLHTVQEFEGTGIGLALVKRIITRHGGRVWAEGAVDGGACFYFSLPRR